jgi:hypothetical protein
MSVRVDYQQVADIYTAAQQVGQAPVIAVAEELGLKYSAAVGRVRRARARGLLPLDSPGAKQPASAASSVLPASAKLDARRLFTEGAACEWCGGLHSRACPRVKRFTLVDGKTAEVEFWPPGTWPEDGIIWPEDAQDSAEDDHDNE